MTVPTDRASQTFERSERAQWSSERAFILSSAAAAVGLGNLWRFPYMAGENGGAAFILAYLICIALIGIPLMLLETGLGRLVQGGPVPSFRRVHRHAAWFGWVVVALTTVITSYYLVITGWTLGYALNSLRGSLPTFDEFSGGFVPVWLFLVTGILVGGVLIGGLAAVERVATFLMPALLVGIVLLVGVGLASEGRGQAASFLLDADYGRLANPGLWVAALGQAFYGMAIGQGYLMTYGSHLPNNIKLARASTVVAITDVSVALLAGWMIFPFVFAHGLQPDTGSNLAFSTLPVAFNQMAFGGILAAVFFPLLFVAAFSSSIAGTKVITTTVRDELALDQTRAVAITITGLLVLGLPSALSYSAVDLSVMGQPVLDVIDRLGATRLLIVFGVVGGTLVGWALPLRGQEWLAGPGATRIAWYAAATGRFLPLVAVPILVADFVR